MTTNKKYFVGFFIMTAIIYGGRKVYNMSRGLRNNNAGNIRKSNDDWKGLSADQSGDDAFFIFDDAIWGVRALMKILINYQDRHGITTIDGIINRWAPPVENDTNSYVRSVSSSVGVEPLEPIDVRQHLIPLAHAIIKHENGIQPYSEATLREAVALL